ncbi:MAG: hypothetical protein MUE49_10440 [Rhodospirillales bacterium]|jgi:hypothetical protein|nr:hypothetical protein [Rhodospirillales bacterium]
MNAIGLKTASLALALAIGGLSVPGTAQAATVGYEIFINGNLESSGTGGLVGAALPVQVGSDLVSLSWISDPDPTIDMGATVIDGGVASTFRIAVTLFFDPIASPFNYFLSGSVSLTDGTPNNTVSISPSNYAGIFTLFKNQDLIASIGGAGGPFGPGGSFVHGPFLAAGADCDGVTGPAVGGCTSMTLVFDFAGTGGGDVYGLTGKAVNKPVPVPAALPLMLSAMGAVGLVGMRRKR